MEWDVKNSEIEKMIAYKWNEMVVINVIKNKSSLSNFLMGDTQQWKSC